MTQTIIKVPAVGGGAFDPTDIELTDNTSGALLIKEGSNEYMRIDTTNGSELNQLKMPFTTGEFKYMQETSAGSYPFIKCNQTMARLFPGADGGGFNFNRVEVTTSHVHLTSGGSEIRIGGSLPVSGTGVRAFPASGHSWTELLATGSTSKIQRLDGLKMLEVDTDSNATFTLDDSAGGIFKVQDDAGTPNEFLKIDSDTSASLIEFNVPSGQGAGMTVNLPADGTSGNPNTGFQILPPSGSFKFGRQATGIYSGGTGLLVDVGAGKQLTMTGAQYRFTTSTTPIIFNLNDASGGSLQIIDAADAEIFKVEENSSLTHTLDGASAATFKVVDSNATPKTYLSITESTQSFGADPYVHKVTLGDNNGYFKLGSYLRMNAQQGGGTALYGPASYYFSQSKVTVTTNQTYNDFDPCSSPYTMTMGSGATGDVTINSGFAVRGDYQTGASDIQSYPVLWVFQNDNATHDFILSFDGGTTGLEHTKSGDTDAAALISAAGLTLTPGQRYIVRFQKIVNELLLIESVDKH